MNNTRRGLRSRVSFTALISAQGHEARARLRRAIEREGDAHLDELVGGLEADDPVTRWEAVNLLGAIASPRACDAVVKFALGEREFHARWRAFWAASRQDRDRVVRLLLKALTSGSAMSRRHAALMLSMMQRDEGRDVLIAGLSGPDEMTQWESLSAIRALGLAGCERQVARCLDPSRARALRQEAAMALGSIGTALAARLLLRALGDPDPQVRWRAAAGLARARRITAMPALRRALARERDAAVRREVQSAIEVLEGRDGGTKAKAARGA
jgi:HEAT repeat protein